MKKLSESPIVNKRVLKNRWYRLEDGRLFYAIHMYDSVSVFGQVELLDARGLLPAVGGSCPGAAEVVPDRPLGNAQEVRRLSVGLAALLQDLDRHELLPCELCQGGASERAWDVQNQLESP